MLHIRYAQSAILGTKIVTDESMVDLVEDWSACRSPSRAKRRRARGFKTRLRIVGVPQKQILSLDGGKTLIMHPETERQMKLHLAADMTRRIEENTASAILGGTR